MIKVQPPFSAGDLPLSEESEQPLTTASITPQVSPPPPAVVTITGLTKRYDLRPVLSGIQYRLEAGRTLVLLGPNGAGKTTLLRILATLTKPSTGQVLVGSADVVRDATEVRRMIGYVGHQPMVYAELSGLENLLFFAKVYGLTDGAARAEQLLDRVGLRAKARDRVGTYSRGQVQRLALVRGLLHEPQLLLLDEPETGLDADAVSLLRDLVGERREAGLSTIFTTHQLDQGLVASDEALALVRGRVAYAGSAAGLDPSKLSGLTTPPAGAIGTDVRGTPPPLPGDEQPETETKKTTERRTRP
jgi:heme ABC exporter ATP-binding subunit CcmA